MLQTPQQTALVLQDEPLFLQFDPPPPPPLDGGGGAAQMRPPHDVAGLPEAVLPFERPLHDFCCSDSAGGGVVHESTRV
jgi:hypothetical protein